MNAPSRDDTTPRQRVWAVGSGKGGVGKSLISTNLAIMLSNLQESVIAVDLDLGNANMHTCLGIKYPRKTLVDFFDGTSSDLTELILDTPVYNLKFISGAGGVPGLSNPAYAQKQKLMRYIERLPFRNVVLDLGAGTSHTTIDFFLSATDQVVVTTPEPTAIQSAYNFLRICVFRKLQSLFQKNTYAAEIIDRTKAPTTADEVFRVPAIVQKLEAIDPEGIAEFKSFLTSFSPKLVINMVLKPGEAKLGYGFREVVKRYLDMSVEYAGSVSFDSRIRDSLMLGVPHLLNAPGSPSSRDMLALAPTIFDHALGGEGFVKNVVQRELKRSGKAYSSRVVEANSMDVDPSIHAADKIRQFEDSGKGESTGFHSLAPSSWSKIAIDMGTSYTRIYVKGRGVILNEPSLMCLDENSGKIVALGLEAKAMTGRAHSGIKMISPLAASAITDYSDVKRMIQEFIRQAKRSTILIRPGVILTIQPGLTSLEKRAFLEFIRELGAREVHLVYEPLAAAIGAGLPVDIPRANMVVNIGGGSTTALVISISGIVAMASQRVGGKAIDTAIARHLRDIHNFSIGDQTAEWIKVTYAQASKTLRDRKFDVRGQSITQGIPSTLTVSTADIRDAIAKPVERIIKVIRDLLEQVPPELAADLVDRGMTLTGGGAFLSGLDSLITATTGIGVKIAPNSHTATVEGAGRMLDDFQLYRRFFIKDSDLHDS